MTALRSLYLAVGATPGSFFPFLVVILADRGFSAAGIGVVMAVASVAQTAAVPVWGHLGDVTTGRARAIQIGAAGSAAAVVLFAFPVGGLLAAALVFAFLIFQSALQPLADALALARVPVPERDFARIRLFASFAFAISSIACGILYDRTDYWATAPVFAAGAVWVAASAIPFRGTRYDREPAHQHPGGGSRFGTSGEALALAPRLPAVLLAIGLVYLGVLVAFTYLPLRISDLGGGSEMVALAAGISALAEVPGMLVAGAVAARIGLRGLFVGACLVYAVCIASWVVVDVPAVIVATRAVTGLAFGGIVVASALTVGSLLPSRLQATGQALYQTVAFGISAVIANLLGGLVYDSAGPAVLFGLTAVSAVAAALVGVAVYPRRGAATGPLGGSPVAAALAAEREAPLGM